MGAAKLLDGFVCAPGQLKGEVAAAPLVGHTLVCLQADAHGGGIADDGYQLAPLHEGLLLLHVHQLLGFLQGHMHAWLLCLSQINAFRMLSILLHAASKVWA